MTETQKILLVEDNPDDQALTLKAFRKHIEEETVNLMVVNDGQEAIDYLESVSFESNHSIDLILLDLKMPKVGGLEVLKYIRNTTKTKFVPVVILTTSLEESDLVNAYRLGVNSYIRKPIEFSEFLAQIQAIGNYWLSLNQLPREEIC